ncbi:MAG TPA: hypothetical protein VMG12_32140 [Polyangiaceae bacterium]|nr:hypothetical protein [Polyangiaceae bacterium]
MLYLMLLFIGIAAIAVYLLVVFREVPGAMSERWGELEGLPADLGEWTTDEESEAAVEAQGRGLVREVRTWREPGAGWFGRDRLVLQVRYKNAAGEIESVEPDRKLERRRVKAPDAG